MSEGVKNAFIQDRAEKASKKCGHDGCPQQAFKEGLCIDHFRNRAKAATPAKLVVPDRKVGEEVIDEKTRERFKEITRAVYQDQCIWYLNGFWPEGAADEAEEVWDTFHKFVEQDRRKKKGNELNEVEAHHFLQSTGRTMTALELRNELRRIDVDANGQMAILEYLLFRFQRSVLACINNPQGGGEEENAKLKEAQERVQQLNEALAQLQVQLAQEKQMEAKAKQAEADAKDAEASAKHAEAVLLAAEEEARKAADDLQAQQDAFTKQCEALEAKTKDESLGTVSRNKAVQELAQLKGTDPLPLRKAKITQDAAVRKVAAERKRAEAARAEAEKVAQFAVEERKKAEEQAKKTEEALADTEKKAKEASDLVEKLKQSGGVQHGAVWWLNREIAEARKYMPQRKQ